MKKKVLLILLVAVVLTGCGTSLTPKQPPLPTVALDANVSSTAAQVRDNASGVKASGVVVPALLASLSTASGGFIQTVHVAEGDTISKGDVLVTFAGIERLNAAVEASNLALLMAQQDLNSLNENADLVHTIAQQRLANAQKTLDEVQKRRLSKDYRIGSDSAIESAQADLILANDRLDKAQDAYNYVSDRDDSDVIRAGALSALSAARQARDRALATLNYLKGLPNDLDVNLADANLQAALAEVSAAQKELDKLNDGPDADSLALLQAKVRVAQAQLAANQAALDDLELKAPFDGTVIKLNVHTGEWSLPGQPLLELADMQHLRGETTDLSERDVPGIQEGQAVVVYVKALGEEIKGTVLTIAPLADLLGGDVVYKTTINLESIPPALRAGMTIEVRY
jgi:multidrug efflux pump subunit AcrA (membrane-fusion protein)